MRAVTYRWRGISARGQGITILAVENDERKMRKVLGYACDAQISGRDGPGVCWAERVELDRVFAHEQVPKDLFLYLQGHAIEQWSCCRSSAMLFDREY